MAGRRDQPSRAWRWSWLVLAILAVVLVDRWSRQPPERFSHTTTQVLDTSRARSEQGHAYWISLPAIAAGVPSDKDGVSPIVLLEDSVELEGHAQHADIRTRGEGRYSHWGGAILFSARDGSDPRINGRRYELQLPPTIPRWHRAAQIGLLLGASLLLVCWLHATVGPSPLRTLAWGLGGAAGLALLALAATRWSPPARELRAIRAAVAGSAPAAIEQAAVTASPPRTRHLLRGRDRVAFTTDARLTSAAQQRVIELRPTGGDGRYTALEPGSALRSVEQLDIAASDLESMVLELEVTRGGSLTLWLSAFEDLDTKRVTASLSFNVSADPEPQTIRFQRPALGGTRDVRYVAIRGAAANAEAPIVRVHSLRYALRLDSFGEKHSGFDPVELRGSLRPALWQSVRGRASLPLKGADGTLLKFAVGALTESPEDPIDFAISAIHDDGRVSVLERSSIEAHEGWRELALDLPTDARELVLEGERLPPRSALLWSGARVIDRARAPRHIVLILADTLRWDALGCYGRPGDPTPALDRLAREGARFERAFSQDYWTRPSMASIMTGYYVAATGVHALDHRLPGAYETLAEQLGTGGLTTVGIVTNTNAGPDAGLDQGFDRLRHLQSLTVQQREQTDRLIDEIVLPTLDELEDDDVFLYLHLMEPHAPYGPPEVPDVGFPLPEGGPPLPFDSRFDRSWSSRPTAAQRVALYDYDVRSMDRALGELFTELDRRWQPAAGVPPIVAFLSDHGEQLGERDQWGHGFADLYPENVQVPLILRAPGRIPPGTLVPDPVEIRHLGATLLDLAGLAPGPTDGSWRSFLPLLDGAAEAPAPPFAVSAGTDGERSVFTLFGRQYGYVTRFGSHSRRISIFSDSGLDHPVTARWRVPLLERAFLRVRHSYLDSQSRIHQDVSSGLRETTRTIDPQTRENLKALGYLQD